MFLIVLCFHKNIIIIIIMVSGLLSLFLTMKETNGLAKVMELLPRRLL